MSIKVSKTRIRRSKVRLLYLCLLDNLQLDDNCDCMRLGDFTIRRHSYDELTRLLRGRDDLPPDRNEKDRMELWSDRAWVHYKELASQSPGASALDWARADFNLQKLLDPRQPFRECVQALNLLKPSDGPVAVCSVFLRPFLRLQTSAQLASRHLRGIVTGTVKDGNGCWSDIPVLNGCQIAEADEGPLGVLEKQLRRLRASDAQRGIPDSTHLKIALHFFERANETMGPSCDDFSYIDPLMSYDASLEALLIREQEKGAEAKLAKRVCAALKGTSPHGPAVLANFVKRVFLLRSKIAHGVWPVWKIARYVNVCPTERIQDGRGNDIPKGRYDAMFPQDITSQGAFCGFLTSLREVTRRTIRYFMDQHTAGCSRDAVLRKLDGK